MKGVITAGGLGTRLRPLTLATNKHLGLTHLEFAYQEGEGGIPIAIALAEKFAAGEPICVILGDNTTDADISPAVENFKDGSVTFLKEVPDPQRYGVPVFDSKDKSKIVRIEEKPKEPKSKYASTGLYIFDNKCFDFIRNCKPSARGELEIPDVQNQYIEKGKLKWEMLKGFWTDAGKFETLFAANAYWAKKKGTKV